jgi:hypothetical protein
MVVIKVPRDKAEPTVEHEYSKHRADSGAIFIFQ